MLETKQFSTYTKSVYRAIVFIDSKPDLEIEINLKSDESEVIATKTTDHYVHVYTSTPNRDMAFNPDENVRHPGISFHKVSGAEFCEDRPIISRYTRFLKMYCELQQAIPEAYIIPVAAHFQDGTGLRTLADMAKTDDPRDSMASFQKVAEAMADPSKRHFYGYVILDPLFYKPPITYGVVREVINQLGAEQRHGFYNLTDYTIDIAQNRVIAQQTSAGLVNYGSLEAMLKDIEREFPIQD